MLKLKYLDYDEDLAIMGLKKWTTKEEGLTDLFQYFRISSNAVYPYHEAEQIKFLRISPKEEKILDNLKGELEFLCYLEDRDYPALKPLKSLNGKYIEVIDTQKGTFYVSAFERVKGEPIEDIEISDAIIFEYGKQLGKLHALSETYVPNVKKWCHKDVLQWIHDELIHHPEEEKALEEWKEISQQMESLKITKKNYGLIHFDFEVDNVFYDEDTESCYAIDFEDGMYHWFGVDIVVAFESLLDVVDEKDLEHAKEIFMKGYASEYEVANVMMESIPLFSRFNDLYSYAKILYTTSDKFEDEPDWMIEIREKLEEKRSNIYNKWI